VSLVPVFAVVGRLGLPVVAAATGVALWATSWAIAASVPASAVAVAMPERPASSAGSEQVGVAIPSVVFGQADGLGQRLTAGRHTAVLRVWLAAGSPSAAATVRSTGGEVRGCTAVALRPAQVNTLHCAVDVAGPFRLSVVTSVAGQSFHASFAHLVR
jgi:hypothetical protein